MRFVKPVFLLIILIFTTQITHAFCYSKESSHKRYVEKSDYYKKERLYGHAVEAVNKHLVCYPDKEAYIKLAQLYHIQKKYYLEGLIYKKLGMIEKYEEVEKHRKSILNTAFLNNFSREIKSEQVRLYKLGEQHRKGSVFLYSLGGALTLAGLSLFTYNKVADGRLPELLNYSLILTGLSTIASAAVLNFNSNYRSNSAKSVGELTIGKIADPGTTFEEHFVHSGAEANARKLSARSLRNNGIIVTVTSAALLAFSISLSAHDFINLFGSIDNDADGSMTDGLMLLFIPAAIIYSLPPAIVFMVKGISMIVKSSKWSKLKSEEQFITLNSIAPMINPITKTYGISMGFSF